MNLETLSGADSVHHTYGFCYQSISSTIQVPQKSTETTYKKIRKTKDVSSVLKVSPTCRKKLKMSYLEFTKIKMTKPESLQITKHLDFMWIISINLLENNPMWTDWNTEWFIEKYPRQRVQYMQHIHFPPTWTDVVKETTVQSKKVSEECGFNFAVITYNLVIAKIAKKIQNEEPDEFKDVFIMFGAFHIERRIFTAIGKLIERFGRPFLLIEPGVIVPVSMNRLYNIIIGHRPSGHITLSTALHGLHFQLFLMDTNTDIDLTDELKVWLDAKSDQLPLSLMELSNQYQKYVGDTFAGKGDKTAPFWMKYCRVIDYFLLIHRSIKTNDIDLFKYVQFEIYAIFFVINQPNYARWMTYYALELENIQNE